LLQPIFISTIKDLSPLDAKILSLFDIISPQHLRSSENKPYILEKDAIALVPENPKLARISITILERMSLIAGGKQHIKRHFNSNMRDEKDIMHEITEFGEAFVKACVKQ
jgi:hypothetical protein